MQSAVVHGHNEAVKARNPFRDCFSQIRCECRDSALPGRMIADHGYSANFGLIYLDGWIDTPSEISFEDRPQ